MLSCASNIKPNSRLSCLHRSQWEFWVFEPIIQTTGLSSQGASCPPALPLPNLRPQQGCERKGDLNVSPGMIWYYLLSSAKSQKQNRCEMEAAVCITRTVAARSRWFRGTFQRPTSQAERKGFVPCIHPWKQQLFVFWGHGAAGACCRSCLSAAQRLGRSRALPGSVHSSHGRFIVFTFLLVLPFFKG